MKTSIEEDYVKIEHKQCPVCGVIHTHNCGILMSKHLKAIPGNGPSGEVVNGMALCKEHNDLHD